MLFLKVNLCPPPPPPKVKQVKALVSWPEQMPTLYLSMYFILSKYFASAGCLNMQYPQDGLSVRREWYHVGSCVQVPEIYITTQNMSGTVL